MAGTYEYRGRKGGKYAKVSRKSTNANLRWIGYKYSPAQVKAGYYQSVAMRAKPDGLYSPEPLVCCGPWRKVGKKKRRECFLGDESESWSETVE